MEAFKDYVEPMFSKDEFIGCKKDHKYKWKCKKCGLEFEDDCLGGIPRCPTCYPIHCNSFDEIELLNFVKTYFPNAKRDRNLIYPLEVDILIEDIKLAIEYDGSYWHSTEFKPANYHLMKTQLCNEKGYRLIHIWEDEWKFDKDKIKERLHQIFIGEEPLNFLGEIIKLDRSWYNNIDVPNYSFKRATDPLLIKRRRRASLYLLKHSRSEMHRLTHLWMNTVSALQSGMQLEPGSMTNLTEKERR